MKATYDFDNAYVTVTLTIPWHQVSYIMNKGSLEDDEEEIVVEAIKAAFESVKLEYDEETGEVISVTEL
jgi:hypothetical protein